jgi:hypothetical protein
MYLVVRIFLFLFGLWVFVFWVVFLVWLLFFVVFGLGLEGFYMLIMGDLMVVGAR